MPDCVENCPTHIIDDFPAVKEEISPDGETSPHERVADAIADLISSPDGRQVKMIGLEGGWGMGKSTVINFLKYKFPDDGMTSFHVFDTWSHEGDPLRRTFLESCIKHFQNMDWVDEKEWDGRPRREE